MTDTKPIEPSVEALRDVVKSWSIRPDSVAAQALAAYDQLKALNEAMEADDKNWKSVAARLNAENVQLKAENEALKARPIPVAVLDQIANMQGEIDTLRSGPVPFTCFKCGDGQTPLHCLNCAGELLNHEAIQLKAENVALKAHINEARALVCFDEHVAFIDAHKAAEWMDRRDKFIKETQNV